MKKNLAKIRQKILRSLDEKSAGCYEPTNYTFVADKNIAKFQCADHFYIFDSILASLFQELPMEIQDNAIDLFRLNIEKEENGKLTIRVWAYPEIAEELGLTVIQDFEGEMNNVLDHRKS